MALFGMENFAFGTVSGTFDASQTTLPLAVTHGARFNTFPAIAVLWNIGDFNSAHDAFIAGDAELIELVTLVGDAFTVIKRGQDGTSGIATTTGGIYQVSVVASRSQWDKVCRAQPDGAGPFDAILSGTAGDVSAGGIALARFVNTALANLVFSIQGSISAAQKLWIGNTINPDVFEVLVSDGVGLTSLIHEGITMVRMDDDGALGLLLAAGGSNPDQVHIGETLTVDRLTGLREILATISSGVLDINSPFIRVSAEGGPGADNLDELTVPLVDVPFGSRIFVILEPNTTGHNITVRDKSIAGGSANISLNGGGTFNMQAQGEKIALITDGVGPTGLDWEEVWRTPPKGIRDKYVLVEAPGDFPAPSAGVITLAAGVTYEINGTVSIGTDQLDASLSACIRGTCFDTDKLLTSNATSLISSTAGLTIDNIDLRNTSGPIFDIDGGGTASFVAKGLRIASSSSLGDIDNCLVISFRDSVVKTTSDGFTFDGTNGFVIIADALSQANLGTFTFLTLPATATFSGLTIHDIVVDSLATQTALDISASATIAEKGVVTTSAFSGAGTALTGITKADVQWQFRSNTGILDSKIIGEVIVSANATETVISTIGVFVPINATFSDGLLERFTRSGDTLTYIGEQDVEVGIIATLNVSGPGATDRDVEARLLVNGSPAGFPSRGGEVDTIRTQTLVPRHSFTISNGDTVDIEVANNTDTQNLIIEDMLMTVSER